MFKRKRLGSAAGPLWQFWAVGYVSADSFVNQDCRS
jgi:hypothetical protein